MSTSSSLHINTNSVSNNSSRNITTRPHHVLHIPTSIRQDVRHTCGMWHASCTFFLFFSLACLAFLSAPKTPQLQN